MKFTGSKRRGGFTVLETSISITIWATLMGLFIMALERVHSTESHSGVEYRLLDGAQRALEVIVQDLTHSGYVDAGGTSYPVFFENGNLPGSPFDHSTNPPHPADGPAPTSREIVFLRPADADDDGWPDTSFSGITWDSTTHAYVLMPGPDGRNTLQRRTSAGETRILSRNVDRLIFDNPVSSGYAIPLDSIRIRIELSDQDRKGMTYRHSAERVIRLGNGGMAP